MTFWKLLLNKSFAMLRVCKWTWRWWALKSFWCLPLTLGEDFFGKRPACILESPGSAQPRGWWGDATAVWKCCCWVDSTSQSRTSLWNQCSVDSFCHSRVCLILFIKWLQHWKKSLRSLTNQKKLKTRNSSPGERKYANCQENLFSGFNIFSKKNFSVDWTFYVRQSKS